MLIVRSHHPSFLQCSNVLMFQCSNVPMFDLTPPSSNDSRQFTAYLFLVQVALISFVIDVNTRCLELYDLRFYKFLTGLQSKPAESFVSMQMSNFKFLTLLLLQSLTHPLIQHISAHVKLQNHVSHIMRTNNKKTNTVHGF